MQTSHRPSSGHRSGGEGRQRIPIYCGKYVVGAVEGTDFLKNVSGSRHFLRQPPGIALDYKGLREAHEQHGAVRAVVRDKETNIIYRAPISLIFEKGQVIDRGWGKQVVLPFEDWETEQRPIQLGLDLGGDVG